MSSSSSTHWTCKCTTGKKGLSSVQLSAKRKQTFFECFIRHILEWNASVRTHFNILCC